MWKKYLSVLLALAMLISLVQPVVFARGSDASVHSEWASTGHSALADAMTGLQDASVIKAISDACDSRAYLQMHPANTGIANPRDYAYRGCNAYHAIGNYVASARYLYALARRYKYGTAMPSAAAFDAALTGLGKSYEATNRQDIDSDVQYMAQYCESLLPSGTSYQDRMSTAAFGMLFHLLGDIYAHRAVVPVSSASVTSCKSYGFGSGGNEDRYFVMSDFRTTCSVHRSGDSSAYVTQMIGLFSTAMQAIGEGVVPFMTAFAQFLLYALTGWIGVGSQPYTFTDEDDLRLLQLATNIPKNTDQLCDGEPCFYAMQRIAQLGVLQCKDVKYFLNDSRYKTAMAYYEDQAPEGVFYAARYTVARAVMQQFVTDFNANSSFNPKNFLPIYTDQMCALHLRIDCLYNYLKQTNQALDTQVNAFLRVGWWSARTDSLFDYTTIVYNGSYFVDPAVYPSDEQPAYAAPVPQNGKTAEDFYL